jgi:hypothetical protein
MPSLPTAVAIAHEDLAVLSVVAMLRYPVRTAEQHRLDRMRAVLEAASELSRRLESHTHCTLVNYRGSHGAGDLVAETEALSAALQRYGQLVAETALEYRRAARPLADLPEPRLEPRGGEVRVLAR